jgi:pimeloyl-ACP methyl ester carboxylesterase
MGAEALAALRVPGALPALQAIGRVVGKSLGHTKFGRDLPDAVRLFEGLQKPGALSAFARTLRSVVDVRGQFVTMLDRCYLTQSLPLQIIWGEDDLVIPASHARIAHEMIPGSRLEIFENAGHMPFHDDPARFVEVVERFIDSTEPGDHDPDIMRTEMQTGTRHINPAEPAGAVSHFA